MRRSRTFARSAMCRSAAARSAIARFLCSFGALLGVVALLALAGCGPPATDAAAQQDVQVQGDDPGLHLLAAEVERLAEGARGRVGVAALHLETGRGITLNGGESFPMASTYKVPIAVRILGMADRGEIGLGDLIEIAQSDVYRTSSAISDLLDEPGLQVSVRNLLELMLQISDNIATDVLMRAAGGSAAVTGAMRDAGVDGIRVDRPTWALIANWLGAPEVAEDRPIAPEDYEELLGEERSDAEVEAFGAAFDADPRDTATPEAMAELLRMIWEREALSEESSALLLDIMYRCRTGEGRLKGVLPAGTEVAHKTGTIGGTTNDVGIIDLPDGAGHVVAAVFVKGSEAEVAEREAVIAQIARAVHDYFLFNRGE